MTLFQRICDKSRIVFDCQCLSDDDLVEFSQLVENHGGAVGESNDPIIFVPRSRYEPEMCNKLQVYDIDYISTCIKKGTLVDLDSFRLGPKKLSDRCLQSIFLTGECVNRHENEESNQPLESRIRNTEINGPSADNESQCVVANLYMLKERCNGDDGVENIVVKEEPISSDSHSVWLTPQENFSELPSKSSPGLASQNAKLSVSLIGLPSGGSGDRIDEDAEVSASRSSKTSATTSNRRKQTKSPLATTSVDEDTIDPAPSSETRREQSISPIAAGPSRFPRLLTRIHSRSKGSRNAREKKRHGRAHTESPNELEKKAVPESSNIILETSSENESADEDDDNVDKNYRIGRARRRKSAIPRVKYEKTLQYHAKWRAKLAERDRSTEIPKKLPYTENERKAMIEFLCSKDDVELLQPKGLMIWSKMIRNGIMSHRSPKSLQNHFVTVILPNIETYFEGMSNAHKKQFLNIKSSKVKRK